MVRGCAGFPSYTELRFGWPPPEARLGRLGYARLPAISLSFEARASVEDAVGIFLVTARRIAALQRTECPRGRAIPRG